MWRFSEIFRVKIHVPCTRHRVHLWPVLLVASLSILKILHVVNTPVVWPFYRNFHYPELPVPFVSVSPLKNVPVARNAWIVSSCSSWSDELVDELLNGGWKIVIITVRSRNYNCRLKNCIILDSDARHHLKYKLKDFTAEENCAALKNLGYLYAIEHGAEFIYELDGGHRPMDSGHPRFIQSPHTGALVLSHFPQTIFNPLHHFGEPSVNRLRCKYVTCKVRTPAVQQGLTITTNKGQIIDSHSPPVVLSAGVYAPYNSFNTFYTSESFWSLLLIMPSSNYSVRSAEFHRSFWTQRLLALLGHSFAFLPPNAACDGSSCEGLETMMLDDVDGITERLIQLLQAWNCSKSHFFDCVKELCNIIVNEKIWDLRANDIMEAWIDDLVNLGYKQPPIATGYSLCISHAHAVHFKPNVQQLTQEDSRSILQEFCRQEIPLNHFSAKKGPSFVFDTILLVVVFNHAHYHLLHLLDNIFKDHFPNLIYCGPSITEAAHRVGVSYVNATDTEGYFSYECLLRIMEMGYQVDGYMVISDDVLVNYWNLKSFDLNKVWAPSIEANGWMMDRINGSTDFYIWHSFMGKNQVNQAFDEIMDILGGQSPYSNVSELVTVLGQLWLNRQETGFGNNTVVYYPADIYYLPAVYSDLYYHVLQVFRRFDVFLEFAVPTTIECLSVKKVVRIAGKYDWSSLRNTESMMHFNTSVVFLHPLKLSIVMKSNLMKLDYCKRYVRKLLEHW